MQLGAYDVVAPDEGVDGYEGLFVKVGFWLCSPDFLAAFKHEEVGSSTTANGNAMAWLPAKSRAMRVSILLSL